MNIFAIFLTLIFIYLKLTGAILWAWVWVLAPLWILWLAVPLAFFVIALVLVVLAAIFARPKYRY